MISTLLKRNIWVAVFAIIIQSPLLKGQALNTSITGKIICGYQGWFNCNDDGANLGWKHYNKAGKFEPGFCSIDLWPDMSECGPDEKYNTPFAFSDNKTAPVFSSCNPKTVSRHFEWMKEYGIDGVFVQRFVGEIKRERTYSNLNHVFDLCYEASVKNDRLIGVMYDLSGSGPECVDLIKKDWISLSEKYKTNKIGNKTYLSHHGKPLVAIWGVGFNDGRKYTLSSIIELLRFFKSDPMFGGCDVLLGVPTYWRTFGDDCIKDTLLHNVLKMSDIIHPWTIGRYKNNEGVNRYKATLLADQQWCDMNHLDYMPVVFPGFSWQNLKSQDGALNQIPRNKGSFYWQQLANAISCGSQMIYVAMFDEMDEGTCIFKCTNNPPIGDSKFCDFEGLPSDQYLWLTGKATAMLKKQIPFSDTLPQRFKK